MTPEELMLFNQKIIRAVAFAIFGFCLINLSDHSFNEIIEVINKNIKELNVQTSISLWFLDIVIIFLILLLQYPI